MALGFILIGFVIIFVIVFLVILIGVTVTTTYVKNVEFYSTVQHKTQYSVVEATTNVDNLYLVVRPASSVTPTSAGVSVVGYLLSPKPNTTINVQIEFLEGKSNHIIQTTNEIIHKEIIPVTNIKNSIIESSECFPNTKIPRKIMQTYISNFVGKDCYLNTSRTALLNDDCEYMYFQNNRTYLYIAENFPPEILEAYNRIIPGAFKADIFRLCWLYVEGGIYMDISMQPTIPFRKIISQLSDEYKEKEALFVYDQKPNSQTCKPIYNAFIVAQPKSQIIKELLYNVCHNLIDLAKKEDYSLGNLSYTGPILIGKMLCKLDENKYGVPWQLGKGKIFNSENTICNAKYKNFKSDRINIHYSVICGHNQQFAYKFTNENPNSKYFHCLGENWGTSLLCKNIRQWNSYNYDYVEQKKYITENFPSKLQIYSQILDEGISDVYFCLLRLYHQGGWAINPYMLKNTLLEVKLDNKKDFIYSRYFIYAQKPKLDIVQTLLSFIENECVNEVYSKWEEYINVDQDTSDEMAYASRIKFYTNANKEILFMGNTSYSKQLNANNNHLLRVLLSFY